VLVKSAHSYKITNLGCVAKVAQQIVGRLRDVAPMTQDRWIEHLKCPNCGKTGNIELSEAGRFECRYDVVPAGFKVVYGLFGTDVECETCNRPIVPSKQP
jgi:hypothetical protein